MANLAKPARLRHVVAGAAALIALVALFLLLQPFLHSSFQSEAPAKSAEQALQAIGLSSQDPQGSQALQGFTVDSLTPGGGGQEKAAKLALLNPQENKVLKIEAITGIGKASAGLLLEDEALTVKALYEAALSPYPGEISNQIVCNERFKPVFGTAEAKLNFSYFALFATDRLTYGACSEDLVKYKAILAWAYCEKKKTLYRFELFTQAQLKSAQPESQQPQQDANLGLITNLGC